MSTPTTFDEVQEHNKQQALAALTRAGVLSVDLHYSGWFSNNESGVNLRVPSFTTLQPDGSIKTWLEGEFMESWRHKEGTPLAQSVPLLEFGYGRPPTLREEVLGQALVEPDLFLSEEFASRHGKYEREDDEEGDEERATHRNVGVARLDVRASDVLPLDENGNVVSRTAFRRFMR